LVCDRLWRGRRGRLSEQWHRIVKKKTAGLGGTDYTAAAEMRSRSGTSTRRDRMRGEADRGPLRLGSRAGVPGAVAVALPPAAAQPASGTPGRRLEVAVTLGTGPPLGRWLYEIWIHYKLVVCLCFFYLPAAENFFSVAGRFFFEQTKEPHQENSLYARILPI
jgi:hypothetical protein